MSPNLALCIGCGCDDNHACWDDAHDSPCFWERVDYAAGLGVCSACPECVATWDAGSREPRVPIDPADLRARYARGPASLRVQSSDGIPDHD